MDMEITNISTKEIKQYKNDFAKGAKLFKEALENFNTSKIPQQKEEFKKVMKKTLTAMNQVVSVALSKDDQKKEVKLRKDFNTFISKDNSQSSKLLHDDIIDIEKSL